MPVRLDERLSAVASLARGRVVADIGCDHGKLGYYLLGTERAERIIATDVSAASLKKAEELAKANGVEKYMETRLGDGLDVIESGEADIIVIAGLGGDTIADILSRARAQGKAFQSFVLSPNTHPEKVRAEAERYSHRIVTDALVKAGGKYYVIIKTETGAGEPLDDMQLKFGAFYKISAEFKEYAVKELEKTRALYGANPVSKPLEDKIRLLETALGERR